jgi:two-component system LytT family response regulator
MGSSFGLPGFGTAGLEHVYGPPIRVTLAEPDAMSCRLIRSVLQDEPDVTLDHIDHTLLISSIQRHPADIVILDINTPSIRHVESWESLGISPPPATILTTYDAGSTSTFAARAIDLLEKPFDAERFQRALELAMSRVGRQRTETQIRIARQHLESPPRFLDRLAIETGQRIVMVRTTDIEWIQSSGNQIRIHVGRTSHLIRQSLTKLQARLDPSRFLRVHRNAIVNLDHVEEFNLPAIGNMFVKLRSGFCLPLRKSSRSQLRKTLTKSQPTPSE